MCNVPTKWKDHPLWVSKPVAHTRSAVHESKTNMFVCKWIKKIAKCCFGGACLEEIVGTACRRLFFFFLIWIIMSPHAESHAQKISPIIHKAFWVRLARVALVWGKHDERHQWHHALIFVLINSTLTWKKPKLVKETFFPPLLRFQNSWCKIMSLGLISKSYFHRR